MNYDFEISAVNEVFNEFQQKYKNAFLEDANLTINSFKQANEQLKIENIQLSEELFTVEKRLQEVEENVVRST